MKTLSAIEAAIIGGVTALSCSTCTLDEAYHKSADLPQPWRSADTLFFPMEVADPSDSMAVALGALIRDVAYDAEVEVRYNSDFRYAGLSLLFELQYCDSQGLLYIVGRRHVEAPLVDADGRRIGDTWGSLLQTACVIDRPLTFPYAGSYRMAVVPDYDTTHVAGLVSLGLMLHR